MSIAHRLPHKLLSHRLHRHDISVIHVRDNPEVPGYYELMVFGPRDEVLDQFTKRWFDHDLDTWRDILDHVHECRRIIRQGVQHR